MKEKLVQLLMLSGFILLLLFTLEWLEVEALGLLSIILLFVPLVLSMIFPFIKPFKSLNKFKEKFPKITIYLVSIGWTICFVYITTILAGVAGYNTAMAKYHGLEYDSSTLVFVSQCLIVGNFFAVIVSLLVATALVGKKIFKDRKSREKI